MTVGTLYTTEELKAIRAVAEKHRLSLYMDGARFANAVAAFLWLQEPLRAALRGAGWHFCNFIAGCPRLMCSWSTGEGQVDRFLANVHANL